MTFTQQLFHSVSGRVEDIFGFSYGHLFETVENEARRQHRADLLCALGYDGLVYANEIEAAADNPSSIALASEDQPISNQPINSDSYVRRFAA